MIKLSEEWSCGKHKIQHTENESKQIRWKDFWCNYFNSNKSIHHRKTKFREKIGDVDEDIPDGSGLVTATVFNTKINEVENKIQAVTDLPRKTDYILSEITFLLLIIINLRVTYLMQR